jgi:hypothetical protein
MNTIGVGAGENLDPHSNVSAEIIVAHLGFVGMSSRSFNGTARIQEPEAEGLNLVVVHYLGQIILKHDAVPRFPGAQMLDRIINLRHRERFRDRRY